MKKDILIFGDICPDNDYKPLFQEGGKGVFDDGILKLMEGSSFVLGNLECPATKTAQAILKCGPSLKAEPEDVQYLKAIGFDALSLANNHILDYGTEAVKETVDCCHDNGVLCFGAGENATDAAKALETQVEGKALAVISFAEAEFNLAGEQSPGANHFDVYTSLEDIRGLKESNDYVIVLYHGGIEHYKLPSPELQKKCRAMIKAGADLVLCQHSHCIGTLEEFEGGTILYGQGNTAFGYRAGNAAWNEGFAVSVDLEEKSVALHLMHATAQGLVLACEEENTARIAALKSDSAQLQNPQFIREQWKQYCLGQEALDLALLYGKSRVFNKLNRILGNRLIKLFYRRKKQMITMNLIRCEAHHEVVTTILENNSLKNI